MGDADSEIDNNGIGVLIPDHCGKTERVSMRSQRWQRLEVMVILPEEA